MIKGFSGKDCHGLLAKMVHPCSLLFLHNVVLCRMERFQSYCCICEGGYILLLEVLVKLIQVFGWTDSTLTLFTLWGTLDFPLFFFPSALLLRKSLRLSVVTKQVFFLPPESRFFPPFVWRWDRPSDACLSSFRPLSPHSPSAAMQVEIPNKWLLMSLSGSIINAIGGPIAMGAPIQISAAWFPPHVRRLPFHFELRIFFQERTRATSIGQMFNALGVR